MPMSYLEFLPTKWMCCSFPWWSLVYLEKFIPHGKGAKTMAVMEAGTTHQDRIDYIMLFIKQVEGEQWGLTQTTFEIPVKVKEQMSEKQFKIQRKIEKPYIPTAAGCFSGQGTHGIFCEKSHLSGMWQGSSNINFFQSGENQRKEGLFHLSEKGWWIKTV